MATQIAGKHIAVRRSQIRFFEYKDDGFLFVVHQNPNDPTSIIPIQIELIVLEKARVLIPAYLKQLMMGGFGKELTQLREQAKTSMSI